MKKIVGNKIKELANEKGVTLYSLGAQTKLLKGGRIYQIANKKEMFVSVQNAYCLAQVLEVPMEDLFIIE